MNNAAAIGYAIMAAQQMGLDKKQVEYIAGTMGALMDEYTEEEATEVYRKN